MNGEECTAEGLQRISSIWPGMYNNTSEERTKLERTDSDSSAASSDEFNRHGGRKRKRRRKKKIKMKPRGRMFQVK